MTDFHWAADEALFRWINTHNAPWLDTVMLLLSNRWLGVGALAVFGVVLVLARARYKLPPVWFVGILGLVVAVTDTGGARLWKPLLMRQRPCFALADVRLLWEQSNSPSLPSLHAANVMAVAVFLLLQSKQKWLGAAVAVLAFWVGYSRVYTGVHWPTDVLAGYLWGSACAAIGALAMRRTQS